MSGRWSRSARGMAAVATGTLSGQAILILTTPILARIYPPASFGHFAVIVGVAAVVGPAAALKFDAALLVAPTEAGARRLLRMGLISSFAVSTLAGLVALCVEVWSPVTSWQGLRFAPLWISALVLASATYTVLTQASLREKNYSAVARRAPVQSFATAASQLSLSYVSHSGAALMSGQLIGRAFGYMALFKSARNLFYRPDTGTYKESLRRYWKFPLVFAPSSVLNSLGTQLPLILVAAVFGISAAGELGMAQRFAFIPGTLLGASVGQVIAAELASEVREQRSGGRVLYLRASAYLGLMGVAAALVMFLGAPLLLPFFLGETWAISGSFVRAMSVCVGLGLVASPLSQVYLIHQSLASVLIDASRVVLIVVAIVVAYGIEASALVCIWLMYGAQSVNYIVTWVYGLRIVSRPNPTKERVAV